MPYLRPLQHSNLAVALKVLLAWTLSNVSNNPHFRLQKNLCPSVHYRASSSLLSSQVEATVLHSIRMRRLTDRRPTCYLFLLLWLSQG